MALFEFRLPDIGEGVTEGEVVNWLVQVGDQVAEDEPMVEVMTDKATVVIGAPKAGKIAELKARVGDRVQVGAVLVVIETGNGVRLPATGRASQMAANATELETAAATSQNKLDKAEARPTVSRSEAALSPSPAANLVDRPLATPAVRKLARELGVDLREVKPSAPGGKLTREDVLAHSQRTAERRQETVSQRPPDGAGAGEKRIPFIGLRRRIAERLEAARDTAVHFTFVEECEVERLTAMRDRLKPEAKARGVELNYLPFIVQAAIAALKKHPLLNSALDTSTNELVMRDYYNIGIATATEQGLVVPVIRNAQNLDLWQIAQAVERLADGARRGKLSASEMNGSTFTITSLGRLGGYFATPIINLPNVGILGVHRIKQRPVVREGRVEIGSIMLLSLSFDHRIVDGHVGAAFAYDVINYLENPTSLFG